MQPVSSHLNWANGPVIILPEVGNFLFLATNPQALSLG